MAYTLKSYAGGAGATDVASNFNSSASSCTVRSSLSSLNWTETSGANAGQPLGTSGNFVVVFDAGLSTEEKILCSSISGTAPNDVTLNFVTRGYDGTTASAHAAATNVGLVYPVGSSVDLEEANYTASQTVGKVTTKGDLLVATATNTFARFGVGANGLALVADSTQTSGLNWKSLAQWRVVGTAINYTAAVGDWVEATATCTITSPPVVAGATFGVYVAYAASNASPVTISASGGNLSGPGLLAVSGVTMGANGAYVSYICDGTNWVQQSGNPDTGWVAATGFANSWTAGSPAPAYRLIGNTVRFRGNMSGGASGTSAFTLNAGYRPPNNVNGLGMGAYNGSSVPVAGALVVTSAGVVQPFYGSGGVAVELDGISFTVD